MTANNFISVLIFFILCLSACDSSKQNDFPSMEDRYFGQKPPGLTPELFAPQILSPDGLFEGGSFSPDMKEFYFTRRHGKYKKRTFFVIRFENNSWGEEAETDIKWPLFSADGDTMYVGKEYKKRTNDGWSEPNKLGEFLEEQAHGLTVSANGTFYFPFFKKEDKGHGNLGYSRLINGKYEKPTKLGSEINKGEYIAHPHIAPDESYLMWDVERDDNYGTSQPDIYISFKEKNGSWGPAINMGNKINTPVFEQSPRLTPDGKFLFFKRGNWVTRQDGNREWVSKSYWVDAKIIETLRAQQQKS
jgi:hypothetical protein